MFLITFSWILIRLEVLDHFSWILIRLDVLDEFSLNFDSS